MVVGFRVFLFLLLLVVGFGVGCWVFMNGGWRMEDMEDGGEGQEGGAPKSEQIKEMICTYVKEMYLQ
jgi:hypothetical protein